MYVKYHEFCLLLFICIKLCIDYLYRLCISLNLIYVIRGVILSNFSLYESLPFQDIHKNKIVTLYFCFIYEILFIFILIMKLDL